MTVWVQDASYALRRLARSPGFAAAAVISLALGIAANATIFSMVSTFVLRPAPVGNPATLVSVHLTQHGGCCNHFSAPYLRDLSDQAKTFSGVAGYYELLPVSIGGHGDPERVWGQATTSNFFDVVQLRMALGRGFARDDEHLPVVVLGYGLWQRRFAADPAIVGRPVTLSGHPYAVVGVAPPSFRGVDLVLEPEFWVPLDAMDQLVPTMSTADRNSPDNHWLAVVARLKSGVSHALVAAELTALAPRIIHARAGPDADDGFRFEQAGSLPPREKAAVLTFLGVLSIVVLLLLAIACANVANLFLARAKGRQREMAVRIALGATSYQLLRPALLESMLVALGGGLAGLLLSLWATQALSAFHVPAPVPVNIGVSADWRVLLYAFVLSAGSGLVLGFVPAWAAARPILASALRGEDALARPGRRWALGNVLVIAQIAMSLVLLCATGLFLRSLQSAANIDIGFRSRGLLMMSVDPALHGYSPERTVQFLEELRRRLAALPGVTAAVATDIVPLSMGNRSDGFRLNGQPNASGVITDLYMATPGFFDVMGIHRVAGRDFANESATAPRVGIVNEAFAHQLFRNENPIGHTVIGAGVPYQVIGVVTNTKSRTLGEGARPVLYRSLVQTVARDPSFMGYSMVVRSDHDLVNLEGGVRREIASLDPSLAVFNVATMPEHLRNALFLPRLAGTLFGVFGFVGLVLATVGLYGVISYSVTRRRREIGVRMALGAQVRAVQGMIIRQGMVLAAIAVLLGIPVALAVAKFSASFLYGIQPYDGPTFVGVPLFLVSVALLACWLPARRASQVNPQTALREE